MLVRIVGAVVGFAAAAAAGCGEVKASIDAAAVDAGDDIDADLCTRFEIPSGGQELHSRFCVSALGFNPGEDPTSMNLSCPGVGTGPGSYGLILRTPGETQADGCPATDPVTRILAPNVDGAVTQTSTGQDVVIAAGDRLRVRLACRAGIASCNARIQITGAPMAGAGLNVQIFPTSGFQVVTGTDVIDVDVQLPAGLVGATADINLVLQSDGVGTSDVMFENPHLAPAELAATSAR